MRYAEVRIEDGRFMVIYCHYEGEKRHIDSFHSYSKLPTLNIEAWVRDGILL